jgi:hypothetical protein
MPPIPLSLADALNASARITGSLGAYGSKRVPFLWSSRFREDARIPPLEMRVNPESVAFSQPKRIRKRNTQGGTTFFHFADDRGRDLDVLVLSISGKTGFINAANDAALASGGATVDKLRAWYNFYALTREPMVDPASGAINSFECTYQSVLFPRAIVFRGHFDQALTFTDGASDPFLKGYSVSFTVRETEPELDQLVEDLSQFILSAGEIGNVLRDASTDLLKDHAPTVLEGAEKVASLGGVSFLRNFRGA